jgi:hypothetical protein
MNNQYLLFENKSSINLCKSVQKIDKKIETVGISGIESNEIAEDIRIISDFFGVDAFDSVMLVPFIHSKLMNKRSAEINSLLCWLKVDLTDVLRIHKSLHLLTRKEIIRKYHDEYDCNHWSFTLTDKAYRAVMSNKCFPRKSLTYEKNGMGFLKNIHDKLELLRSESADFSDIHAELVEIMDEHEKLEGVRFLKGLELDELELGIALMGACQVLVLNQDHVNVERIMNQLDVDPIRKYRMSNELLKGDAELIKKDVIECEKDFFKTISCMTLTEGFKNRILGLEYQPRIRTSLKRGTLISPEDMRTQNLFYNELEEKEMKQLEKILKNEEYNRLSNNLKKQGKGSGIPVLLFGKPGTGKTSSVYDLAVRTGRKVYKVEMETINNAFVGESEKNLMEIFKEYESLMKTEEKHPILLLNECDGIIKKRTKGSTPVAEMMNTMVTLLLNKMDEFEGILFATMNEPNFDEAFDRRFLFKMKLDVPGIATRKKILKDVFPELENDLIGRISEKYPITGGQISNIKKKMEIKHILEPDVSISECFEDLCEKEFVLSNKKTRNPIGFITEGRSE